MAIKNCPNCNRHPRVKTLVSCVNEECPEFDVEHFVWDWQKLPRIDQDKFNEIFEVSHEQSR